VTLLLWNYILTFLPRIIYCVEQVADVMRKGKFGPVHGADGWLFRWNVAYSGFLMFCFCNRWRIFLFFLGGGREVCKPKGCTMQVASGSHRRRLDACRMAVKPETTKNPPSKRNHTTKRNLETKAKMGVNARPSSTSVHARV